MNNAKCPHCGSIVTTGDSNYYACEKCSAMFHTVENNGKIEAEFE